MNRKTVVVLALLAAVSVAGAAVLVSRSRSRGVPATAAAQRYHCPMHPEIIRDKPGDCPICGMRLVPIETPGAEKGPSDATSMTTESGPSGFAMVQVDAQRRRLIGLETSPVARGPFHTSIRTVGRLAYDERRLYHVHTRYEAYVEHVTADFTGKYVKKGEVLAYVYSPDLYATQQEYLLALKASRSLGGSGVPTVAEGGRDLLDAARQRLILWEIAPADIAAVEKRGEPIRDLPLYAPISGYVTGRTAYHGMKVTPADSLFDIVDISHIWVLADVYEYELPRLAVGQQATMTLSYWPDRTWNGTVTYIYPAVDEKTRTVKVRIELDNPKEELKPEMFADVTVHGRTREVLQVPDDAVLTSGTRNIVFLDLGEGKLMPREVRVGDHGRGVFEIREGLQAGDVVVRSANFLVDSESRLKAAISAMTSGGGSAGGPTPSAVEHKH